MIPRNCISHYPEYDVFVTDLNHINTRMTQKLHIMDYYEWGSAKASLLQSNAKMHFLNLNLMKLVRAIV